VSVAISRDGDPLPPYVPEPTVPLVGGSSPLPPELYAQRAAVIIALRGEGMTIPQIAEALKLSQGTVKQWIRRARAEGALRENIDTKLDQDTIFRALEVLHDRLEEGNLDAALAVMKGRGHFRTYNNNQGAGTTNATAIQIIYTTPNGGPVPMLTDVATLPGQIVGTPRVDKATEPEP
jgi:predicted transcriptional regulator